ncbi:tetratricopeptide repeat protein [Burkholderia sp. L27(2015)]|uniref:tetratricopeptide repeat protein n=1 Tax=Burkholderia sp. L27(2015) TaxID=1641858 RepID=UPI00131B32AB|nr:tetratricopeptide repeat protein [Burkholderia sp. L27(2015)]
MDTGPLADAFPESPAAAPSMVSAAAQLQQALALHQQGRLSEAEAGYQIVLQQQPEHFDALHLLGVIALQNGQTLRAIDLITQALAHERSNAYAYSNLASAYQKLGRYPEAIVRFERALALRPDFVEALSNLGNTLRDAGRREEALASYNRALALKPDRPDVLANRGNVLRELRRFDEALDDFDRGLALDARSAVLLFNRANVLFDLGRLDGALVDYDAALAIAPDYCQAISHRSSTLRALRRYDEALAAINQALLLQPDSAEILTNRGDTLGELARYAQALSDYDRALALKPAYPEAWCNRGNVLRALRRYDEALASYIAALDIDPEHAVAHMNEGLCRLLVGDMAVGWEKYEWRFKTPDMLPHVRRFEQSLGQPTRQPPTQLQSKPLWHGQLPLSGKRILLYAEQGFGDTIQFCRYAQLVAERGAHVILEVQPALKSLILQSTDIADIAQVFAQGEALPEFDYQCPLLSLPLACATTLENIPAPASYLHAEDARIRRWETRLGKKPAHARVGLAWSGNPEHSNDRNRSLPLTALASLLDIPMQYVSVQKLLRDEATQAPWLAQHGVAHFGDRLQNFADTAALLSCMDLVITVDTAVAHLAGALGRPVWVLLPYGPDWRWLTERDDSPWYPSMRLFRQTALGDWDGVIERVRQHLQIR